MEEKAELLDALDMALAWIDAVPAETSLPAMPGFDRDWVNGIRDKARRALSPHGKGVVEQDHGPARDHAQATGGSCEDGLLTVVGNREDGFSVMRNGVRTMLFARKSDANAYVRAVNARPASHDEQAAKGVVPGGSQDRPTEGGEAVDQLPNFPPLMLTNLSYSAAIQQMRLTKCCLRRPHWCAPVLSFAGSRFFLDDEGEEQPWHATEDDRRANDWMMVPNPAPAYATPSGEIAGLREALEEVRDLLMERRHGNPARSAGHNARLAVEDILKRLSQSPAAGEG